MREERRFVRQQLTAQLYDALRPQKTNANSHSSRLIYAAEVIVESLVFFSVGADYSDTFLSDFFFFLRADGFFNLCTGQPLSQSRKDAVIAGIIVRENNAGENERETNLIKNFFSIIFSSIGSRSDDQRDY